MSPAYTSPSLTPGEAKTEFVGYLALIWVGTRLPLQVLASAADHYIGTIDNEGPVSRESIEYFPSDEAATHALATGAWTQRLHP
ncbi:hypothetical protein NRY95_05695 [Xanthomonas campestris pv. phormiicola]|nr:hypothetical protein [Xanthomonas campestris pv. phormiicola]UYC17455.1 hypothetical protein NRY95_05695 [Xanthomonas campestris pv. phormiicola]